MVEQCDLCPQEFRTKGGLGSHRRFSHGIEGTVKKLPPKSTRKGRPPKNPDKIVTQEDNPKDPTNQGYLLHTKRPIRMSGKGAYLAEELINSGWAANLDELFDKNLEEVYNSFSEGGEGEMVIGNQTSRNRNPMDILERIQANRLIESQIDNMAKPNGGKNMDNGLMQTMVIMQMMKGMNQPQNDNFMQQMFVMKMMNGEQNGRGMDMSKVIEVVQMMNQNTQPKPIDPLTTLLMKNISDTNQSKYEAKDIIALNAQGNQAIREMETRLQEQRLKNSQELMNLKLEQIQRDLVSMQQGGETSDLDRLKDSIKAVQSLSKTLSGEKEEPSMLDYAESFGRNIVPAIRDIAAIAKPQGNQAQQQAQEVVFDDAIGTGYQEDSVQKVPKPQPQQVSPPENLGLGNVSTIPNKKDMKDHSKLIPSPEEFKVELPTANYPPQPEDEQ